MTSCEKDLAQNCDLYLISPWETSRNFALKILLSILPRGPFERWDRGHRAESCHSLTAKQANLLDYSTYVQAFILPAGINSLLQPAFSQLSFS